MFRDRAEAGRGLARRCRGLLPGDTVVLGLPRGGVPVAFEVAMALGAPLDVILVKKLGVPGRRELAMGAIGEDGVRIVNDDVVRAFGVSENEIADAVEQAEEALAGQRRRFRAGRPRVSLEGKTALVIDDGIATGATARAACDVARVHGAARVVFAAPVGPTTAIDELHGAADEVILLDTPDRFYAIGQFYDDFTQVPDDEVLRLLERSDAPGGGPGAGEGAR